MWAAFVLAALLVGITGAVPVPATISTATPPAGAGATATAAAVRYRPHVSSCRRSYTSLAACLHDHFHSSAVDLVDSWNVNSIAGLQTHEFSRAAHSISHTAFDLMRDCMHATKYVSRRSIELASELERKREAALSRHQTALDVVRASVDIEREAQLTQQLNEHEALSTESLWQWRVNADTRNPFLFNHLKQTAFDDSAAAAVHDEPVMPGDEKAKTGGATAADSFRFAAVDAHYRARAATVPSPHYLNRASSASALSSHIVGANGHVSGSGTGDYAVWLEHSHGVRERSAHTDRLQNQMRAHHKHRHATAATATDTEHSHVRIGTHHRSGSRAALRSSVRSLSSVLARNAVANRVGDMGDDGGGWGETPQSPIQTEIQRISETISGGAYEFVLHGARLALHDNLRHSTNHTVHRKVARSITKTLTVSLTDSLTNLLLLALSRPYVETSARIVTHSVTPSLTFALSSIISNALTRRPQEDYYCQLCKDEELYCIYCKRSRENQYQHDYYTHYYAHYFSKYYARFYSLMPDLTPYEYFNGLKA